MLKRDDDQMTTLRPNFGARGLQSDPSETHLAPPNSGVSDTHVSGGHLGAETGALGVPSFAFMPNFGARGSQNDSPRHIWRIQIQAYLIHLFLKHLLVSYSAAPMTQNTKWHPPDVGCIT